MSPQREVEEDEVEDVVEHPEQTDAPKGWRPEADTVAAISASKDSAGEGEWQDRGIQDVPLGQVDISDSWVKSETDFKKVSHEDMLEGFEKLEHEVKPRVAAGAGPSEFDQLDADKGLDYQHGYRRIYDAFYGSDAIRLDKDGDKYSVTNGFHRLSVAREIGLSSVPARVIERRR